MNADHTNHDRALRAALERLNPQEAAATTPAEATADPALVREYVELFGLLPYELPPVAPRPEVWEGIAAALGKEATESVRPVADLTLVKSAPGDEPPAPPVEPVRSQREPADLTLVQSSSRRVLAMRRPTASRRSPEPAPARSGWVTFAMAACLVLCLLGFGYTAGKLDEQSATIIRLQSELTTARAQGEANAAELAHLRRVRENLEMITAVARHYYRLQPVNGGSQPESASGVVYVCGQHKRWYLNLQGLDPAPAGQEYQLWFMTRSGLVNGGAVRVVSDAPVELTDQSLPPGTRGFALSLETAGPHAKPEGKIVLRSAKSVSL